MPDQRRKILTLSGIFAALLLCGCVATGTQKPAPVTHYGRGAGAGSAGAHTVAAGDTLASISQRYRIAMRDLVEANALKAPFRLTAGQRIKLPPPQTYTVRAGDTLYEVSRLLGVTTSAIAGQNDLRPPYALTRGQVLRMPSASFRKGVAVPQPVTLARAPVAAAVQGVTVERLDAPPQPAPPVQKTVSLSPPLPKVKTQPVPKGATPARAGKFIRPVAGKIISGYGPKTGGLHNDGINIAAQRGTPVKAAENGVVVYAGNEIKGFGNLILIRHKDGWMSAYGHLDRIDVSRGQTLKQAQPVGTVGSTGSVDSPQLHFELRRGTQALNPAAYMK